MGHNTRRGFTIIEVMLVLAVTGLILIGALLAVNGTVNRERYNSGVKSLIDHVRGKYSDAGNVQNSRSESTLEGCNGTSRGTSNCAIVGKMVESSADGHVLSSYDLLSTGDIKGADIRNLSDDQIFEKMSLTKLVSSRSDYSVDWQMTMWQRTAKEAQFVVKPFTIVIVRLPVGGGVRTFISGQSVQEPIEVIKNSIKQPLEVCVAANGLAGHTTGFSLQPGGTNSSAVEFMTDDKCKIGAV